MILKHPATNTVKKISGGEADTTNNRMEIRREEVLDGEANRLVIDIRLQHG